MSRIALPPQTEARLLAKRNVTTSGCWEWSGYRDRDGYGFMSIAGRDSRVHRISAALWLGFDMRSPEFICHHCDNPPCFNPDHLFPGTPADNMRDASAKGRLWSHTKYPKVKPCKVCGTEYEPHVNKRLRSQTCSESCASHAKSAFKLGRGYTVTPEMYAEIKHALDAGEQGKLIAARFGVSRATVSEINTGKRVITA